jgi:glutamine synthetase adenylyltransferase
LSGKTSSRNRALQATYGDRHPHRPYSRPRHILELTIMRVHGIYRSSRQSVILPALSAAFAVALVASPVAAQAQDTGSGSAMSQHETKADMHAETIDQRIATLHEELKITPAEESDWNAVATTMRENADAMEKLANKKESQSKQGMTAVEDLQTYSQFAQEHVDHLKKLTSVFETLYNAMPSEQKKVADEVFARSQHQAQDNQG